jgi:hypothetical protein
VVLFQLSFTVLLYYHSSCILRFRGRPPRSAKNSAYLRAELKVTTRLTSEYLRSIRCAFYVKTACTTFVYFSLAATKKTLYCVSRQLRRCFNSPRSSLWFVISLKTSSFSGRFYDPVSVWFVLIMRLSAGAVFIVTR